MPEHHKPSEPAKLSIDDGEKLQEKRVKNVASRNSHTDKNKASSRQYNERRNTRNAGHYKSRDESKPAPAKDPWGNFKGKK